MPSEEELKKARDEEREDGFGQHLDGEWWIDQSGKLDKTTLESGTILQHHTKETCSGNCCLHGTSKHPSCRMPRQWRHDRQIIEHVCPHGVGHPCYAAVDYAISNGRQADAIHGCDGCCVVVDNRPNDVDSILNEVDKYTLMEHSQQLGDLTQRLVWAQDDIYQLQDQVRTWRAVSAGSALCVALFVALSVIFNLAG